MNAATVLERARLFLYRNARLIDRKRFEYFFEGGTKEGVVETLRAYQNDDGGFGNALEPDIRCPYSQPVPTEMALGIMDEVNGYDPAILQGVERYLKSIALPEGGFPLVFRNAGDFPHAPWWRAENDDKPSINPTGRIIGLLLKQKVRKELLQEAWFVKSVEYVWRSLQTETLEGYHDGVQWIAFLENTPERSRAAEGLSALDDWLRLPGTIERNVHAEGYVHKVLDWVPAKGDYAAKFISGEEVQAHLEALLRQQQEDGGWPISFPAVSPSGELEWRGWVTVERLKTLKSYGVI